MLFLFRVWSAALEVLLESYLFPTSSELLKIILNCIFNFQAILQYFKSFVNKVHKTAENWPYVARLANGLISTYRYQAYTVKRPEGTTEIRLQLGQCNQLALLQKLQYAEQRQLSHLATWPLASCSCSPTRVRPKAAKTLSRQHTHTDTPRHTQSWPVQSRLCGRRWGQSR